MGGAYPQPCSPLPQVCPLYGGFGFSVSCLTPSWRQPLYCQLFRSVVESGREPGRFTSEPLKFTNYRMTRKAFLLLCMQLPKVSVVDWKSPAVGYFMFPPFLLSCIPSLGTSCPGHFSSYPADLLSGVCPIWSFSVWGISHAEWVSSLVFCLWYFFLFKCLFFSLIHFPTRAVLLLPHGTLWLSFLSDAALIKWVSHQRCWSWSSFTSHCNTSERLVVVVGGALQ